MKLDFKPTLVVIGTLLIGIILGALTLSVFMRYRMDRLRGMAGPRGFQHSLIAAIGPMSEAQRTLVEEEVRRSSVRIDSTMNASRSQIDVMIDSMNVRLDSLLTPDQRARLHRDGRHGDHQPDQFPPPQPR
jgi:hypothetical protein